MKRQQQIKVGLFVIGSIVLLAGGLLFLMGSRLFRAADRYEIVFAKSVTGLLPGSRVEYQGVTVGKVAGMRLTTEPPPRVVVAIDLLPGTSVRQDTYATLIGSMVTNIRYVELRGGTKGSRPLKQGGTITAREDDLNDIKDRASEISERVLTMIEQVQREVLTPQNIAAVGSAIRDLSATAATLRTTMDDVSTTETRAQLKGLLRNVSEAAVGIRRAAATVDSMSGDAKVTLTQLQKTVARTEHLVGQVDALLSRNQGEVGRLLTNLADAAQILREAATQVREDPSRLVWGSRSPAREIPDK